MKNTIIFNNKLVFKQGETLTFFLNENLNFNIENKIFSAQILDKIRVYLKNLKFEKKKPNFKALKNNNPAITAIFRSSR